MVDNPQFRPQIILDASSRGLIEATAVPQPNLRTLETLVGTIASSPNPSALSVFLASQLLWQLPQLPADVISKVRAMNTDLMLRDPIVASLNLRARVLLDALDEFCLQDGDPTTYFQLEPVADSNAKPILEFICQQAADSRKSGFKDDPQWIFQFYLHPERQIPGIWMSKAGTPFTADALLKLERATQTAFLVPAALRVAGKDNSRLQ